MSSPAKIESKIGENSCVTYLNPRCKYPNTPLLGTGKSHVAQAIGHCAVRQGIDVMFTSQTRLLTQINAARATDTLERKLQALARVPSH